MKKLAYFLLAATYSLLLIIYLISSSAYAYTGGGGDTGGGGAGGSWDNACVTRAKENCSLFYNSTLSHFETDSTGETYAHCKSGQSMGGYNDCAGEVEAPNGCPEGYKPLDDGTCVDDSLPSDCDPNLQSCDDTGAPVCDFCSKLDRIISNQITSHTKTDTSNDLLTQIRDGQNDFFSDSIYKLDMLRNDVSDISSYTATIMNNTRLSNQKTDTTNYKLDELIEQLRLNNVSYDLSSVNEKLNTLISQNVDISPIDAKLQQLIDVVSSAPEAGTYDDTALLEKLDELKVALTQIEDNPSNPSDPSNPQYDDSQIVANQQEQISWLRKIYRANLATNEAGDSLLPELEDTSFDASLDPWSAIRGFNVNQNMINAAKQCPSGEAYSFTVMGNRFEFPVYILCDFLGQLGIGVMFLAYITGAYIIVKGD